MGGERDPKQLAQLRDPRIRASKETIQKSLEGNWQEELLFDLKIAWRTTTTFNAKLRPTMSRSVKNSKRFHPKWIYSRNPCPQHG